MSRPATWTTDTRAVILAELRALCRERGTSVILVTHRADAAAEADRVLRLREGRLESQGGDGHS